jgi:hypothetical protein
MQQFNSDPDPNALADSQTEAQRRGEDTWPGNRVPGPSDAEIAYQALDPRLVPVFKQAMLGDSQARKQTQFLSHENAQTLFQQATCPDIVRRNQNE